MSAGGGCQSTVTARTRCGWAKIRECGELLYGGIFPADLKGAAYQSYVRPAILQGSEVWRQKKIWELHEGQRSMVRTVCGLQLKGIKRSSDLMFMLGLTETIDQLAMENSVRYYGHALRREGGHVLRRALDHEVEGQRKKGRPKKTWKKQVEEESVKIGLRREDALCRSKWSVGVNQIAAGLR